MRAAAPSTSSVAHSGNAGGRQQAGQLGAAVLGTQGDDGDGQAPGGGVGRGQPRDDGGLAGAAGADDGDGACAAQRGDVEAAGQGAGHERAQAGGRLALGEGQAVDGGLADERGGERLAQARAVQDAEDALHLGMLGGARRDGREQVRRRGERARDGRLGDEGVRRGDGGRRRHADRHDLRARVARRREGVHGGVDVRAQGPAARAPFETGSAGSASAVASAAAKPAAAAPRARPGAIWMGAGAGSGTMGASSSRTGVDHAVAGARGPRHPAGPRSRPRPSGRSRRRRPRAPRGGGRRRRRGRARRAPARARRSELRARKVLAGGWSCGHDSDGLDADAGGDLVVGADGELGQVLLDQAPQMAAHARAADDDRDARRGRRRSRPGWPASRRGRARGRAPWRGTRRRRSGRSSRRSPARWPGPARSPAGAARCRRGA